MPMRPHTLAALVLGNFCFPSFFERAHLGFRGRRLRFNHLIRFIATQFRCGRGHHWSGSFGFCAAMIMLSSESHVLSGE